MILKKLANRRVLCAGILSAVLVSLSACAAEEYPPAHERGMFAPGSARQGALPRTTPLQITVERATQCTVAMGDRTPAIMDGGLVKSSSLR